MADIPSISITNDFSDNDDDKTDCLDPMVATDCENLESDSDNMPGATGLKLAPQTKKHKKTKKEYLTDCEDMDASDSDEVAMPVEEMESITLEEFLDQGFSNETTRFNGNNESTYDGPLNVARCRSPDLRNSLRVTDDVAGLTDCEDLDASGDEDDESKDEDEGMELPLLLMDENNTVESHDNVQSSMGQHHITTTDSSSSSESSGDEHTPFKSKRKLTLLPQSDTENVLLSDYESCLKDCPKKPILNDLAEDEVINVEISDAEDGPSEIDSSQPVGIAFRNNIKELHKPGTPQFSKLLAVLQDPNEGLTDVENLNSSDEDDDNTAGGLTIPLAIVRSQNAYLTDVEDVEGMESDIADEGIEIHDEIKLPKAVRQLILVQESNTGNPISKVIPLSESALLTDVGYLDKGLTDTEDLSDVNEDLYDTSKYLIEELPEMDIGKVTSSDKLCSRKLDLPDNEEDPITDTEDITDVTDSRKKRHHRHRPSNRHRHNKLTIDHDNTGGAHTDVEELFVNDTDSQNAKSNPGNSKSPPLLTIQNKDDGGHTDYEIMSGDEETTPRRIPRIQRNSSPNILNKSDWFNSAEKTTESFHDEGRKYKSNSLNMNLPRLRKLSPTPDAGHTDIEEMTRSGTEDEDEVYLEGLRGETPAAIHRQLNENNSTTQDSNTCIFDERSERLHIKGHQDIPEALTDTEVLEDAGN